MSPSAVQVDPARSVSRGVLALIGEERPRPGRVLGSQYVAFDNYVVAVEPAGVPRMPNGIACDLRPRIGQRAAIGAGILHVGDGAATTGPLWNAVPRVRVQLATSLDLEPDPVALAGRGTGLTPYGDDVLVGFAAGLVLWHGDSDRAAAIAEAAAPLTTLLSATLLRHATRGELPEPAHALLADGDSTPLLRFGHSSGRGMLLGLALACGGTVDEPTGVAVEPAPGTATDSVTVRVARTDR